MFPYCQNSERQVVADAPCTVYTQRKIKWLVSKPLRQLLLTEAEILT